MKKILKCGCLRGYRYCPEAKRLWNLYCEQYQAENDEKAHYYFRQYENHFKKEDFTNSISMKKWKRLMGYDTLIYKIKRILWVVMIIK